MWQFLLISAAVVWLVFSTYLDYQKKKSANADSVRQVYSNALLARTEIQNEKKEIDERKRRQLEEFKFLEEQISEQRGSLNSLLSRDRAMESDWQQLADLEAQLKMSENERQSIERLENNWLKYKQPKLEEVERDLENATNSLDRYS